MLMSKVEGLVKRLQKRLGWRMNRFFAFHIYILLIFIAGCSRATPAEPLEILFIGNSYTFFNDMPGTFTKIAELGGHQVNVISLARGGFSLARHAEDQVTLSTLKGQDWDFVVLQEKSDIPAIPLARDESMFPSIRQLNNLVEEQGGETILFLTWGYRDGLPEAGLRDYKAMQAEVAASYQNIADELNVRVAPVGIAWKKALERDPKLELWMADGSHPSPLGSFLTANVLYAVIFNESPLNIPYVGDGIGEDIASLINQITAETVIEDPSTWNLP
jgi:hypothetical protein